MIRAHVLICGGTGCTSSGSQAIQKAFAENIEALGLSDEVKLVQTGCFGLCALGPVVIVYPDGTFYSRVTPEDVKEIVEEHLLKGRIVDRLVYNDTGKEEVEVGNVALGDTAFYKSQNRVVLRNCGVINPENIDEYIAMDGYAALGKVLTEMTPEDVIKCVTDSGLRGSPRLPSIEVIRAVSSPQTNAPAPKRICKSKSKPESKIFLPKSPYSRA